MSDSVPMAVTVAYDPANGQIVRVHFSHAPVGSEEGAKAAAWLQQVAPPHAKVLHLAPGSMEPGKRYRIDVGTGALIVEESGSGGVSASSGVTIVPQSTSTT